MTRVLGVYGATRLTGPVTINSATTAVTTRSGCSKMKRGQLRAGNCREGRTRAHILVAVNGCGRKSVRCGQFLRRQREDFVKVCG